MAVATLRRAPKNSFEVYERSDAEVRGLEGLEARSGTLSGGEPPEVIEIAEPGDTPLRFRVDVRGGEKTGFYLDQRDNRSLVRRLARGCEVLDAFCYSGGFALAAAAGGARSVLAQDSSAEALVRARENLSANGLPETAGEWREADVFQALRQLRDQGRRFDLVVLDPPKFAPTAALVDRAARAYKDINLLAFKLLRPGGMLASFSCSGAVDPGLFQKNRRRCRTRCGRGGAGGAKTHGGGRSSGGAQLSRGRIPEGAAVPDPG